MSSKNNLLFVACNALSSVCRLRTWCSIRVCIVLCPHMFRVVCYLQCVS
jgi:hypothetical protein